MPGVSLLDMDDLQSVSRANRLEREKEVSQVERIIDQEVGKFGDWWDSLRVAPGIAQLREHAEALRIREIKKTLKQLPNLTDEDAARIEALSRSIVKKLLHNPIATIKENPRLHGDGPEDVRAERQGLLKPAPGRFAGTSYVVHSSTQGVGFEPGT